MGARTIVDKIWASHAAPGGAGSLVVDRIYVHERQLGVVGRLGRDGVPVRCGPQLVACADQQLPTRLDQLPSTGSDLDPVTGEIPLASAQLLAALERVESSSALYDVPIFGPGDHRRGVINVVGPEQGMTVPGALVVGSDLHMATHGAFGAIGLPIDDDELAELLVTGTIDRPDAGVLRISVGGRLDPASGPKDLALWLLARVGPGVATGSVVELGGSIVRGLSIDARMTLCNMAVETGALTALVEPDEVTIDYLSGRPFAPRGTAWDEAVRRWRGMHADPGAEVDGELVLAAAGVAPQVTWGTHAWQATELDGVVPGPDQRGRRRDVDEAALHAQGLVPGTPLADVAVDQVFVGSCTNGRLDDVRAAADVLRGGRVQVPTWVVPGSQSVAREAEAEGLHHVIRAAGAEWRGPGCSLCIGANGDAVPAGARLASTANRPQKGLVGPGARVHVLGPAAAAASALTGRLTDPRALG